MRQWLVELRRLENVPQNKVSKAIGVSQQLMSAIETGRRRPSVDTAKSIAAALNFEKYGYHWTKFFEDAASSA